VGREGEGLLANHLQDVAAILMMSVALGMDSFSLSIGVGLQGISWRRALRLCLLIGAFHVILTVFGVYAGMMLGGILGNVATWFGALLLIGLGMHMVYASLFGKEESTKPLHSQMGTLLFSASVSLDALSVGFSLGLRSATYGFISALFFGIFSLLLSGLGIFIGKRASQFAGTFGELMGAFILIACGVHFLLP
jgi:manganese efflux pump family protein